MTKYVRPGLLASILAGVVCGIGCNPLTFVDFIGPEPQIPPELQALKSSDKNKKGSVNVVVLTNSGLETREEFLGADRQLGELLTRHLKDLAEFNGEKLSFVNLRKVEDYKNSHPHWQEDITQVGKDLKADFVIYVEINSLSMYEKGSRELYRGHADISVSLHKIGDDDDLPQRKQYIATYPTVRAEPVDIDKPPMVFREQFLNFVGKHISWYFMAHPTRATYMDDD
jgi:hypothetical protein